MYTFKKDERLGNYRLQSLLFNQGKAFFQYPFRIQYLFLTKEELHQYFLCQQSDAASAVFQFPAKCLVSVSKRQIKKAVHRNKAKRLCREAYRKNKNTFYTFLKKKNYLAVLAFIYTADRILSYDDVEEAVQKAINKLGEKLREEQTRAVNR